MGRNTGEIVSHAGSEAMKKGEGRLKKSLFASIHKPPIDDGRPRSMVIKKAHNMIPPHIVAEAISTLHGDGVELRFSGPITPTEREYVEQYVLAKYPQYAALVEGEQFDLSSICIIEESTETMPDDKGKSPRGSLKSPRESATQFAGSNLPDLDRTQLEPSRLLDILTKKSSFPGSFISIPEIQAQNKVLKHCGLTDDEYLVLFTPTYRDAMVLVAESYPFFKGNYYLTILGEQDCIKEFAGYKESKVILAPETWLDLRIKGSQLSQYFRKKSKLKVKGLFSYPVFENGVHHSLHWVSEAHRSSWHVLLDATELVFGKDHLNLRLHRPDLVLCSIDNSHGQTSKITCLLVRKKSFDTSMPSPQVNE
ncbi:uncharacterized protein LOC110745384 [Prunus avium]|uniref:Uncharacterized protein LOC110745384 n=1 Tax=Prunus avium TaxID=42229 RepID=A0A6P5RJY2_PRUAV|nr:uncharacterized protein LOC110745384 [Prunus avium]XP_021801152.1 uncharacterized protein LOC110745384 [Prunus avium]XP_021801153.1 uncharacterized protein LOC110745384 [Prunus avium]